jgi:hypothetical protein
MQIECAHDGTVQQLVLKLLAVSLAQAFRKMKQGEATCLAARGSGPTSSR